MKRMSDSLLQFVFEEIIIDPSLVPAQYLPHFYSVLSDLKPDGCAH
jgi:hypothetical protein